MAVKTTAEAIHEAYLTGSEAQFYDNGVTYTFTPLGLKNYIITYTGDTASITALVNSRLTEAQRTAINALQSGVSSADDIIAALQAVTP